MAADSIITCHLARGARSPRESLASAELPLPLAAGSTPHVADCRNPELTVEAQYRLYGVEKTQHAMMWLHWVTLCSDSAVSEDRLHLS